MEEARSFLASIVEGSDDAIIGLTPEGRIASWNGGAETIYGYGRAEAMGRPFSILLLPERSDEMAAIRLRLQRGERIRHFQTLHLRKDGQVLSISLSVFPVRDLFGRIIGASAIARDLTRSFQTAEMMREAEGMYQLLFSAGSDAILLCDADQEQIINVNDAALQLYGYGRDDFSRLTLKDLSADSGESRRETEPGRAGGINHLPPARHRKKDGTLFEAEMSTGIFHWKGRRLLVGIVRDITERKRIQELKHSLALAKEVQTHLLPRHPPRLERFELFSRTLYCQEIGGDYFDFFDRRLDRDGTLGFAVGDVSGHGIGAALLMALVRGVLRTEAEHDPSELGELFRILNRSLLRDTGDELFMTLFYGVLDTRSGSLSWNSAGHGPVFWYQAGDRRIGELPATGIPLGIEEQATYPPAAPIALRAGDILLIGTDGLWEARNPQGEMFDTSRLRQVLATWSGKPARDIYQAVIDKVTFFCRGERQDDMTLMVIKALS
ncbi:MAG: SpoIIE family protein phosphatase [Deltaproteobacteria bacterium]|nr:SpoIIE family protein phosphatase [Deltaproteobacteria bacterium]